VDGSIDPVTGKRRQRAETFRTHKEAEDALAKRVADIARGVVDRGKVTVAEYLDHGYCRLSASRRPASGAMRTWCRCT
jgi:hypothetical protein